MYFVKNNKKRKCAKILSYTISIFSLVFRILYLFIPSMMHDVFVITRKLIIDNQEFLFVLLAAILTVYGMTILLSIGTAYDEKRTEKI